MDLSTLIGCVAAITCVVMAIQPQNLGQFYDQEGIIVIFGGAVCVMMISYPFGTLKQLFKILAKTMRPPTMHLPEVIETMVSFATIARRDGLLALEEKLKELKDPFLLRGIQFESFCEHHLAPIIGRAHVGYLPDGKVVGISKLARVVDAFAHRFQVQEKLIV